MYSMLSNCLSKRVCAACPVLVSAKDLEHITSGMYTKADVNPQRFPIMRLFPIE